MKTNRLVLLYSLGLVACAVALRAADGCCSAADPKTARAGSLSNRSIYQVEAIWTTDAGKDFKLAELRGQPVVLAMFFTSCGYACPRIVEAMMQIQETLPPAARSRAQFVLVSFDDERDTVAALHSYREQHGLVSGSWRLLRGAHDDVRELAAVLGVKYKKDAAGMFSHSNLITILNSQGEIVHQRAGLQGGLADAARALASSR
jgi:protein SCO1/2